MNMRHLALVTLAAVLCASCRQEYDHQGRTPLAGVGTDFLYLEDLQTARPAHLHGADSTRWADDYIRQWVEDEVLYQKASDNIPDGREIEQRVEHYRRTLIMHAYQQELIHQQLSSQLTDDELKTYYARHPELFKADEPLIKGLFIKVPLTAPHTQRVRQWYKAQSQDDIEQLEKYSLNNAVKYEYFADRWTPVTDIAQQLPRQTDDVLHRISQQKHIEMKDTAFYYFLNITGYLPQGEIVPFEESRAQAQELLLSLRQVEFMKQVKHDLRLQAEEKDIVTYYPYQVKTSTK